MSGRKFGKPFFATSTEELALRFPAPCVLDRAGSHNYGFLHCRIDDKHGRATISAELSAERCTIIRIFVDIRAKILMFVGDIYLLSHPN